MSGLERFHCIVIVCHSEFTIFRADALIITAFISVLFFSYTCGQLSRYILSTAKLCQALSLKPLTMFNLYPDCDVCRAKTVGLVRYRTTLAPVNGTQSITTQCADNAHRISSSLSVTCDSGGNWGSQTPQCQCDDGYETVTENGREICQGDHSPCISFSSLLDSHVAYFISSF